MAHTVHVDVVTPERRVWSGEVEILIARGTEGELGVMANHTPLVTGLRDGVLILRPPDRPAVQIATEGGFLDVEPDGVTVLAAAAQTPSDLEPGEGRG